MASRVVRRSPRYRTRINIGRPSIEHVVNNIEKKWYQSFCKAKDRINETFAMIVKETLGINAKFLVLDTYQGVTCRTLEKFGFSLENITAPNINHPQCVSLRNHGVSSPNKCIEDCVSSEYNAVWYDSMTTMGGNKGDGFYVGLFAHRFLQAHYDTGRYCVLAISICNRSGIADSNVKPQKAMLEEQIMALIAWHGYTVKYSSVAAYKHGMIFGIWHLVPIRQRCLTYEFLTWKNSTRLIGFPPGFTSECLWKST